MKKLSLCYLLLVSLPALSQNNFRDSLKQALENANSDTSRIEILGSLAWSYAFQYEDTAIFYAAQGIDLSKKINYQQGMYDHFSSMTLAQFLAGNYVASLRYNFEYLNLAKSQHDTIQMADAYNLLGLSYREQEDYNEALKYERMALTISKDTVKSNHLMEKKGVSLGNIASIYERMNQLDSALIYAKKSLAIIKYWSGLYLYFGNIYSKLGKSDSAFYYYRKCTSLAKKDLINIDLLDSYNQMSALYQAMGKMDSAIYYARNSIISVGPDAYPEGKLRAMLQLASLYEKAGVKDSTIRYLKLSSLLREKLFNREKTRESQSLAFNEKLYQQDLAIRDEKEKNKIITYVSLSIVFAVLVIVMIQWKNNRQKQKANRILQKTLLDLKSTQSQLIQSEKMASLGELTAGIAHEIQNPLNFVNNFSDLSNELIDEMKAELETGNQTLVTEIANDIKQNLEKINHHGKRAADIVKGMLQHSRTSSGQKELTDINALADEYLRLAYHGMRAKDKSFNARFETHLDPTLPKVNVMPQEIGRVLLNLINNAFYAVSEKSKVESQKSGSVYEPTVTVLTKNLGKKIEIIVKDNGNGVPDSIKDKIFQPFFTTKPTGQGTGLGLSLSYDIVKAHGGELRVETIVREGSEFIIQLSYKSIG